MSGTAGRVHSEDREKLTKIIDAITYCVLPLLTAGTVAGIVYTHLTQWLRILLAVSVGAVGCLAIVFHLVRFTRTYKILLVTLIMCSVMLLLYLFLERTGFMEIFRVGDAPNRGELIKRRMQAYLASKGKWAAAIFVALQFAQTTVLPIPGFATTGGGALLFSQLYGPALGPLYSALLSLVGIVAGSAVSFFAGRVFGYRLVAWIVGKESLKKVLEMLKGRDTVVLTLMFVLPFFPDDILCFVAGLSSMGTLYFLIMMTVSRILVIFGTSYVFGLIPLNTWWGLTVWGALIAVTVVLFVIAIKNGARIDRFFRRKFGRRKKSGDYDFAEDIIEKLDEEIKRDNAGTERRNP